MNAARTTLALAPGPHAAPAVRIVKAYPKRLGSGEFPPESSDGIYYLGKHRGRHVLAVYPYWNQEGTPFDLDAFDASMQKIVIPAPLTKRTWGIGYAVARRVMDWGQAYYLNLQAAQGELQTAVLNATSPEGGRHGHVLHSTT